MKEDTRDDIIRYLQGEGSVSYKNKILNSLTEDEVRSLYAIVLSSCKNKKALELLSSKRSEYIKC